MTKQPADLVFHNGRVVTVDAEFRIAACLAIRGSRIVAVGDDALGASWTGPDTRVVDLNGGTLLPGINDSHLHAVNFGWNTPPMTLDVGYPTVRSIADVVAAVAEQAAAGSANNEWIIGGGWDAGYLRECLDDPGRQPTRYDLDAVVSDRPVFLHDFSRHTAWVNTATLQLAGIDADTPAPAGSAIMTDSSGHPTGILTEGAYDLVEALLPPLNRQDRIASIKSALTVASRLGITSFTEPGLGPGGGKGVLGSDGLIALRDLAADGDLTARATVLVLPVSMSRSFEEFKHALDGMHLPVSPDERWFNIVGVKILADGIPPNETAWMYEPYCGGGRGELTIAGDSDDERVAALTEMIIYAHTRGYQVGVHVTGDRAIDTVVDAFVRAVRTSPRDDARHYVIHGDFLTERAIALCAQNGFGVNMNPTIKWTIADLEEDIVGPDRAAYEWPYRDAFDAGVPVASGSDAPVTHPDWLQGLSTMVLRKSKATGKVSGPQQCIDLAQAIRTYTINGAWQDFAEDWKGSLEVGKVADLCVVDRDLVASNPHDYPESRVTMTVVDGRIVHDCLS